MPEIRIRRIRTKAKNEAGKTEDYQVLPCFVMPYMTGYTEDVEKALFLHFNYEVPFDGLVYVFGRDVSYWYRMSQHLGHYSLAGCTAKTPEQLPEDVAADEKHTSWNGSKAYIATTVGEGCFWGAAISLGADEASLSEAYGVFKEESQTIKQDYEPKTANTDGFTSTLKAWMTLFLSTILSRCFLHGFINIRNQAKRQPVFRELAEKVWDVYQQSSYHDFINQLTLLQWWAHKQQDNMTERCFNAVMKLCLHAHSYAKAYDHPNCHRTSNMLDRLMQKMDRYLFMMRYFHGHLHSAELSIRAWALAQNFLPYCSRSPTRKDFISPVHKLNGTVYRDNWLENLLVSASLSGRHKRTHIPLE